MRYCPHQELIENLWSVIKNNLTSNQVKIFALDLLRDIDTNWNFKYYIVAIDTTSSHEVRVFELSYDNIENALVRIYDALVDISWHIETNNWDHSRQYYEGDGSEQLKV